MPTETVLEDRQSRIYAEQERRGAGPVPEPWSARGLVRKGRQVRRDDRFSAGRPLVVRRGGQSTPQPRCIGRMSADHELRDAQRFPVGPVYFGRERSDEVEAPEGPGPLRLDLMAQPVERIETEREGVFVWTLYPERTALPHREHQTGG